MKALIVIAVISAVGLISLYIGHEVYLQKQQSAEELYRPAYSEIVRKKDMYQAQFDSLAHSDHPDSYQITYLRGKIDGLHDAMNTILDLMGIKH